MLLTHMKLYFLLAAFQRDCACIDLPDPGSPPKTFHKKLGKSRQILLKSQDGFS